MELSLVCALCLGTGKVFHENPPRKDTPWSRCFCRGGKLFHLHPDTSELVAEFAGALSQKLEAAEQKYGYQDNWLKDDWETECRQKLIQHIEKGDPLDVAAYCAFMWKRGWSTRAPEPVKKTCEVCAKPEAEFHKDFDGFVCTDCQATWKTAARKHISNTPKFDAMTPEQQQNCRFMGYDPDNPDVPLD